MSGSSYYTVDYLSSVVNEDIPKLSKSIRNMIKKAIESRLMLDPIGFGKPLRYSLKGHRRLRVNHYRVVYRIEPKKMNIVIVAIKHRKDVYKDY